MTPIEQIAEIEARAREATPQHLDSAQLKTENQYVECPLCNGNGEVFCEDDYVNYDGYAQGVQFYGVGSEHVTSEAYYRTVNPSTVLALCHDIRVLLEIVYSEAKDQAVRRKTADMLIAEWIAAAERKVKEMKG